MCCNILIENLRWNPLFIHLFVLYFKGCNSQVVINTVGQLTLCIDVYGKQMIVKPDYDAFSVVI
jgi:hypothetical protein